MYELLVLDVRFNFQCADQCSPTQWGVNCNMTCSCKNDGTCNPANGTCKCQDGWKGADCSLRGCPEGLYGESCEKVCECATEHSKM